MDIATTTTPSTPSPGQHDSIKASCDRFIPKPDRAGQLSGYAVALRSGGTSILQQARTDGGPWARQAQEGCTSLRNYLISAAAVVCGWLMTDLPAADGCEWGASGTRNATLPAIPELGYSAPVAGWAEMASDVVLYGGAGALLCSHIVKFGARLFAEKYSREPESESEPDRTGIDIRKLRQLLRVESSDMVKSLILTAAVIGVVEHLKNEIDKERPYVLDPDYINGTLCMEPDDFRAMPSGHAAVSAIVWQELVNNSIDSVALFSPAVKRWLSKMSIPCFPHIPLASPAGKQFISSLSAAGFGALAGTLRILAAKHDVLDVAVGMVVGMLAGVCSPKIRSGVFNPAAIVNQNTGHYYNEDVYRSAAEGGCQPATTVRGGKNEETEIMSMI